MRVDALAQAAYTRGAALQAEGRYAESAAAYRDAIAISPRATAAYEGLGEVEFRLGRVDEAVAAYRRLMASYPYAYLSELHRQVGLLELKAGRLRDAARDLGEAVTLDPADWQALYWLGHAHERLGNREAAAQAWRKVALINPAFAPVREQLRRLDGPRP
jgi:tetratricopeptide (TPR) repeat protein